MNANSVPHTHVPLCDSSQVIQFDRIICRFVVKPRNYFEINFPSLQQLLTLSLECNFKFFNTCCNNRSAHCAIHATKRRSTACCHACDPNIAV